MVPGPDPSADGIAEAAPERAGPDAEPRESSDAEGPAFGSARGIPIPEGDGGPENAGLHPDDPEDALGASSASLQRLPCQLGCGGFYTWSKSRIRVLKDGHIAMRCPKCQLQARPAIADVPSIRAFFAQNFPGVNVVLGSPALASAEPVQPGDPSIAPAPILAVQGPIPTPFPQTASLKTEHPPRVTHMEQPPLNLQLGKEELDAVNSDMKNLRPVYLQTKSELDDVKRRNMILEQQLRAAGIPPGQLGVPVPVQQNPGAQLLGLPSSTEDLMKEAGLGTGFKALISMRLARTLEQGMQQMLREFSSPGGAPGVPQAGGYPGYPSQQPMDMAAMMGQMQQLAWQMRMLDQISATLNPRQDQGLAQYLQVMQQQHQQLMQTLIPLLTQKTGFNMQEWMQYQAMMGGGRRESPFEQALAWQALQGGRGNGDQQAIASVLSSIAQQNNQHMQSMAQMMQANSQGMNQLLVPLLASQSQGQNAFIAPMMSLMNQQQEKDRQWFQTMQGYQSQIRDHEQKFWADQLDQIAGQVRGKPESEFEKATKELFYGFLLKSISGNNDPQAAKGALGGFGDKLESLINGPVGQLVVDIVRNRAQGGPPIQPQEAGRLQQAWETAAGAGQQFAPVPVQAPSMAPQFPGPPPVMAPPPMQMGSPFLPPGMVGPPQMGFAPPPMQQFGPGPQQQFMMGPQQGFMPGPQVQMPYGPMGGAPQQPPQRQVKVGKAGNIVESLPAGGTRFMDILGESQVSGLPGPPQQQQQPMPMQAVAPPPNQGWVPGPSEPAPSQEMMQPQTVELQ